MSPCRTPIIYSQDFIPKSDNDGHWITLLQLALPSYASICLEWRCRSCSHSSPTTLMDLMDEPWLPCASTA
ncbi:unnamed protein product [Victoria cruziana]